MNGQPGVISVEREPRRWGDRARRYKLILDDQLVDTLKRGERRELVVRPGDHTVFLKIDWCRSPKLLLSVSPGQSVRLVCGPNVKFFNAFWLITFGKNRYIKLGTE